MERFITILTQEEKPIFDAALQALCQKNIYLEGKGVKITSDFTCYEYLNIDVYKKEDNGIIYIRLTQYLQTKEFMQSNGYRRYGTAGVDYITISSHILSFDIQSNEMKVETFIPFGYNEIDDLSDVLYAKDGEYYPRLISWLDALKIPSNGDVRYEIQAEHGKIYTHDYLQETSVDQYIIREETYEDGEWISGDWIEDWIIKDDKEYVMSGDEEYEFTNGTWWCGIYDTEESAREYMEKEILSL